MKKSFRLCAVPDCGKSLSPRNRHGYCLEHREHAPHRKARKPHKDRATAKTKPKQVDLEQQNAQLLEQVKSLKLECRILASSLEETLRLMENLNVGEAQREINIPFIQRKRETLRWTCRWRK